MCRIQIGRIIYINNQRNGMASVDEDTFDLLPHLAIPDQCNFHKLINIFANLRFFR